MRRSIPSAIAALELLHESDERLHAGHGHRVVDARAHAADGAVPGEIREPGLARFGEKALVELRIGEDERNVHPGAASLRHRIAIETARVDCLVERFGLGTVLRAERLEA